MGEVKCSSCGGGEVVQGIHVGKVADAGHIGLDYQTALIITGTEPLVADLCIACGTVVRLRVQNTDRKWWITGK